MIDTRARLALILAAVATLGGCAKDGDFDPSGGIRITRSACPQVAIAAQTGDVTVFNPVNSTDSRAIDVVAAITNVRSSCADSGADVVATATFDVLARRTNTVGAREVRLPYFATVVRGGDTVVSKRVGEVVLTFADGAARAQASATGAAYVDRAQATLPKEIADRLNRERKAEDADAAIDPMTAPDVRSAVARATFELLVGFQLTQAQLQYNATR